MRRYFLKTPDLFRVLLFCAAWPIFISYGWSQEVHPEVRRVRGFDDHRKQKRQMDQEREKGLRQHLEGIEIEKIEYARAAEEYRQQRRSTKPLEKTQAYVEHNEERRENRRQYDADRENFKEDQKQEQRQIQQAQLNQMEELGLPEDRPRFDVKKRALYGGVQKFGKPTNSFAAPVDTSAGTPNYNPMPPPPPNFEDFPPPAFPMDDDLPPPPPPPPFGADDDMGFNGGPTFDEFPPPPPPMDDFQF